MSFEIMPPLGIEILEQDSLTPLQRAFILDIFHCPRRFWATAWLKAGLSRSPLLELLSGKPWEAVTSHPETLSAVMAELSNALEALR